MEISLLKYFLSVARTQSIRESASLIGISPAGLSKGIKSLEQRIGKTLIEPSGRGIRLTKAGEHFSQKLGPHVESLEAILFGGFSQAAWNTMSRLVTFEVFSTHVLNFILAKKNPQLNIHEVIEAVPGDIENRVADNHADLGITTNPAPHPKLSYLKVSTFTSRVFVGTKSKLVGLKLGEIPFVVPQPPQEGSVSRAIGLDGWPAEKPRHIKYRVSMLETALSLCSNSLAAGYFSESLVAIYNENVIASRRLVPHPQSVLGGKRLEVFIVTRKGEEDSPTVRALAKELRLVSRLRPLNSTI
jgi:DNA-binding transcriptional LysR family regulator